MPQQARGDTPGTLHHIVIRGIDGLQNSRDRGDREDFFSHLGELVASTGSRIVAWVLMDNHVHLSMLTGAQGISRFMRCLLAGYAIRYNRKYHRRGHRFQNRFRSVVCQQETYLLEQVR
jgi:REP element-mobilizing transposase RayT